MIGPGSDKKFGSHNLANWTFPHPIFSGMDLLGFILIRCRAKSPFSKSSTTSIKEYFSFLCSQGNISIYCTIARFTFFLSTYFRPRLVIDDSWMEKDRNLLINAVKVKQGNYSLRRPPKLIIPQIFIEQRWATENRFMCNIKFVLANRHTWPEHKFQRNFKI